MSTTTQTSIINRGLQMVGYQSVGSINDNDRGARAMLRAYDPCKLNLLRSNFWSFSLKRIILPASNEIPVFGKANYFNLPGDFVMIAPPDQYSPYTFGAIDVGYTNMPNQNPFYNDWTIEQTPLGNQAIASSDAAPLYLRYVSNSVTESMFDYAFAEAFSATLALQTCEELTQSNTKIANISRFFDAAIEDAKKRNAFEKQPVRPPVDSYIIARF